ncbi:NlpC/P60 family protein [Histomonas meleagridis]|uniref:NlpC/P60 family protein n=1 Tax=Histomonas meleagridis TaxID=135588 RepID=UPI0035599420|nr:NlpC/P60 family protein [Histomonas meleagridis]KAH0796238.1 NlpC/P60 family protein [Histomonas meleagridis]
MLAFLLLAVEALSLRDDYSHHHHHHRHHRHHRHHNMTRQYVTPVSNDDNDAKMTAMINYGLSIQGTLGYTQSSKRTEVFSVPGYSDCSSFCWKLYERYFGIYVGSWTGEQINYGTKVVDGTGGCVTSAQMAKLKPGDLLFYGQGTPAHVEMYIGNGQQLGHGSGMGPTLKNTLTYKHSKGFFQARRYVNTGTPSQTFKSIGTCTCTADGVRVRSSGSTSASILTSVNKGTKMEYDGTKSNGWYHVRVNGIIGYMHPDYVSISSSTTFKSIGTCTCTADGVRVRSSGSTSATILTSVNKGTKMEYDGTKSNGWYHVKVNGIIGYMHPDYVSISSGSSFKSIGTCTCNANGVRVRSSGSTSATILTSVNKGTKMEYDGTKSNGWYHVKVNGIIGYMHPDYVTI